MRAPGRNPAFGVAALACLALAGLFGGVRADFGEYGSSCSYSSDCFSNLRCSSSGTCKCADGWFLCSDSSSRCCSGTKIYGSTCSSGTHSDGTKDCTDNLICSSSTGKCTCASGYAPCDDTPTACCVSGSTATYGQSCASTTSCANNLYCKNGTCSCATGYTRCDGTSSTFCCNNDTAITTKPYPYGHTCTYTSDCLGGYSFTGSVGCYSHICQCDKSNGYSLCPNTSSSCCQSTPALPLAALISIIVGSVLTFCCCCFLCIRCCCTGDSSSKPPSVDVPAQTGSRSVALVPVTRSRNTGSDTALHVVQGTVTSEGAIIREGVVTDRGAIVRETLITPEGQLTTEHVITPQGRMVKRTLEAGGREVTVISRE